MRCKEWIQRLVLLESSFKSHLIRCLISKNLVLFWSLLKQTSNTSHIIKITPAAGTLACSSNLFFNIIGNFLKNGKTELV